MKIKFVFLSFLLLFGFKDALCSASSAKKQNVLIILGPPGGGKGTQAERLSASLKLPHISTGDLFRDNVKNKTDLGKKAEIFMKEGKLVPDDLVMEILEDRIKKPDCKGGYLLDGFPRTVEQAKKLEGRLPKTAQLTVINLDVKDESIIKRLSSRNRSDDTPEVVKNRLKVYHEQSEPVIGYFKGKNLITINGDKTPDEVFNEIMLRLRGYSISQH